MGDQQNYPYAVTFMAACAGEYDYIYVAAYCDALHPEEIFFSRMYFYAGRLVGDQ